MGGTELEVLKAVRKKGGEASMSAIATEIRMSSDYARIVCRGLGMEDYLDVFENGRVRLTEKGMAAVRKAAPRHKVAAGASEEADGMKPGSSGAEDTDGETEDEEKPLSPEEKYRLWASRENNPRQADVRVEVLGVRKGGRMTP